MPQPSAGHSITERTALDDAYRRDRERLVGERDAKIERIRMG
jgi:hypothetical protein